jgi:hypothetical protein
MTGLPRRTPAHDDHTSSPTVQHAVSVLRRFGAAGINAAGINAVRAAQLLPLVPRQRNVGAEA